MVDKYVIKRRLNHIVEGLKNLKNFLNVSEEEFIDDPRTVSAVKYEVIRTFEAVSSICHHIVSKEFRVTLTTYRECFEILAKEGVIPHRLGKELSEMAKFRNMLIHMYQIIDDRKLYQEVKSGLAGIEEFIEIIESRYL